MKRLRYVTVTSDGVRKVTQTSPFKEEDLSNQIEKILPISFNGTYAIEDVPDSEVIGILYSENNLLRNQISALSQRGEFIEDCIAEMAGMVYG